MRLLGERELVPAALARLAAAVRRSGGRSRPRRRRREMRPIKAGLRRAGDLRGLLYLLTAMPLGACGSAILRHRLDPVQRRSRSTPLVDARCSLGGRAVDDARIQSAVEAGLARTLSAPRLRPAGAALGRRGAGSGPVPGRSAGRGFWRAAGLPSDPLCARSGSLRGVARLQPAGDRARRRSLAPVWVPFVHGGRSSDSGGRHASGSRYIPCRPGHSSCCCRRSLAAEAVRGRMASLLRRATRRGSVGDGSRGPGHDRGRRETGAACCDRSTIAVGIVTVVLLGR